MQLRLKCDLTSEEYVSAEAWHDATLERCPFHPAGDCDFARHGTYRRKTPLGTRIPRWYCPTAHRTVSLLADCFAARLPGTLADIEQVVDVVEQSPSFEAAADRLRPDIELPGALRWIRRRTDAIALTLSLIKGLWPDRLADVPPTLAGFRQALAISAVLTPLRERFEPRLPQLLRPLGFRPWGARSSARKPHQHPMGPDPPPDTP